MRPSLSKITVLTVLIVGLTGIGATAEETYDLGATESQGGTVYDGKERGVLIEPKNSVYLESINIFDKIESGTTKLTVKRFSDGNLIYSQSVSSFDPITVDNPPVLKAGTKYVVMSVGGMSTESVTTPQEFNQVTFIKSAYCDGDSNCYSNADQTYNIYRLTVSTANQVPQIDSTSVSPDPPEIGNSVSYSGEASDPDGTVSDLELTVFDDGSQVYQNSVNQASYTWTDVYTPQSDGKLNAKFTATDDAGATTTKWLNRTIDETPPSLEIFKPETPTKTRTGLPLNYTVSDKHLDTSSCKYSKDEGTNFSLQNCGNTTVDFGTVGNHKLTVYASDTFNNTGKASKTLFVDEVNEIRAEDQGSGSKIQEFTATLDNGTDTIGGTAFNNTFNFNTSNVPKGSVNLTLKTSGYQVQTFQLTGVDDSFSLNKSYQLKRSSITVNALDEQNQSEIIFDLEASNGSTVYTESGINSFSMDYKDFNTNNFPTGSVKISLKASNNGYKPRTYYTSIDENSVISITGYLLRETEGIPVSIETYDTDQESLSDVMLTAQKTINGNYQQVSQTITASDGSGSFFLDPDYQYRLTASKQGYDTFEGTFNPANYQYDPLKIQLGTGGRFNFSTRWETVDYKLEPQERFLNKTGTDQISWTVNDLEGDLSEFGIRVKTENGSILKNKYIKTSPSGGKINVSIDGSKYPQNQLFNVEAYFISSGEEYRIEKQYQFEKTWTEGIFSVEKIMDSTGESLNNTQKGLIALIFTGLIGAGFGSRLEKEGAGLVVLSVLGLFTLAGWFPGSIFILSLFALMGVYFR